MISLYYENINYVMTQILKLSCVSFSYVNISYVLAFECYFFLFQKGSSFHGSISSKKKERQTKDVVRYGQNTQFCRLKKNLQLFLTFSGLKMMFDYSLESVLM